MTADHSAPAHPAIDTQYEIIRELGRGGTALVYLARERATGAEVAIKVIRSKFIEDDEALARFAREARFVAQLQHPNVVPVRAVLDLGEAGIAIVMARLAGRTLRQVIHQDGRLAPDTAERVTRDIARALDAAHAMGIVHRDVKPENIFIDDDGRAVLTDFGLARSMSADTQLTMHGVAIGTPAYMAPEQIDGGDLDARADVYSLGLVAWEMLAGHRPWEGETLYAILYHQKHDALLDVRDMRDDVPDRLAEVIVRAIEKERDARWRNMRELVGALDNPTVARTSPRRALVPTETIRFTRPATPPAPATVAVVEQNAPAPLWEPEPPEPPRKRNNALRALSVAAALALVGFTTVAVRKYWTTDLSRSTDRAGEILMTGDSRKPVVMPFADSALRHSTTQSANATAATSVFTDSAGRPVDSLMRRRRAIAPTPELPPSINPVVLAPTAPTAVVPAVSNAKTSIVAGGTHSCFINADGRVSCWGSNDRNQLGTNTTERASSALVAIRAEAQFTAMAAGLSHSCGIARDGAAWCWGNNDHGQLGDRSLGPRLAPVRVAEAHAFRAITAGEAHTCGLDAFGLAWCWGSNARGQLGDTSSRDSAIPVGVNAAGQRFTNIAAGWNFTCAIGVDRRASCWGDNTAGQLGDGTTSEHRAPVPVKADVSFSSLAAGNSHACGIASDGAAYCWGRNSNGQLGDGTTTDRSTPVRVRGDAHFTSITAGAVHTCGLTDDGNAYCWGRNTYGQLGTGRTTDEAQPTVVVDSHTFTSVRAFGSHTCAVSGAGEPFCWGYNLDHQLGDGTRTHRNRPTRVLTPGGKQ